MEELLLILVLKEGASNLEVSFCLGGLPRLFKGCGLVMAPGG